MTKIFEFFWDDLTEECQERFAEFLNFEEGENGNYDLIPFATFEVEEDVLNDGSKTCDSNCT